MPGRANATYRVTGYRLCIVQPPGSNALQCNTVRQPSLGKWCKGPKVMSMCLSLWVLSPYVELLGATSGIVCGCLSLCKNRFGTMHFLDKGRLALVSWASNSAHQVPFTNTGRMTTLSTAVACRAATSCFTLLNPKISWKVKKTGTSHGHWLMKWTACRVLKLTMATAKTPTTTTT